MNWIDCERSKERSDFSVVFASITTEPLELSPAYDRECLLISNNWSPFQMELKNVILKNTTVIYYLDF